MNLRKDPKFFFAEIDRLKGVAEAAALEMAILIQGLWIAYPDIFTPSDADITAKGDDAAGVEDFGVEALPIEAPAADNFAQKANRRNRREAKNRRRWAKLLTTRPRPGSSNVNYSIKGERRRFRNARRGSVDQEVVVCECKEFAPAHDNEELCEYCRGFETEPDRFGVDGVLGDAELQNFGSPLRSRMRPQGYDARYLRLNEYLQPLESLFLHRIGYSWNEIYSFIRKNVRVGSAVGEHILQHIEDFVHYRGAVDDVAEGELLTHGGQEIYQPFFVDGEGVLRANPSLSPGLARFSWTGQKEGWVQIEGRYYILRDDGHWFEVVSRSSRVNPRDLKRFQEEFGVEGVPYGLKRMLSSYHSFGTGFCYPVLRAVYGSELVMVRAKAAENTI